MRNARSTLGIALFLVIVISTACQDETLVTKVDPTKPGSQKAEGVLFSLPETVVVTDVPMTKVDSSPAMFYEWTEFFYPELTRDEYATEEKTTFKVSAPTFSTKGQTDPNNVYMAHIKAKRFETKTLLVEFNDDGIIARTETSSKDDSIDIFTSGAKQLATIAAPLLPLGGPGGGPGASKSPTACDMNCFKALLSVKDQYLFDSLDPNYLNFLNQSFGYPFLGYLAKQNVNNIDIFLTLNAKQRKIIEGTVASPRVLSPDDKLELARAKAAYDKIEELVRNRENLVEKDTPDGVTTSSNLELKLKEIDARIKTMRETYFLGTSSETSAVGKFEFKPSGAVAAAQSQNLFTYAAGGTKPGICSVSAEVAGMFKAVWPKNLKGECHVAGSLFEAGDFRDWKQLRDRLYAVRPGVAAAAVAADPVSAFIFNHLNGATQGLVTAPAETPQDREKLINALIADLNGNQVLTNGAPLSNTVSFASVRLSAETIKLMNTGGLVPADIVRLNRLLLEDAYPEEIYRLKAWTGRHVDLVVDVPPAGIAQTVQTARLKEEGKRGFPYRVPSLAIAKFIDDGIEKGRSDVRIAQFGPVQTLPAGLGGRRSSYTITYYDASGAIKTFNMSADALIEKQNVTDLADAATTLRDAESARLKRETDLLKAKKDKLDAEKALKDAQAQPSPTPTPQ